MKKIIFIITLFFSSILLVNANRINKITMDVYLDKNGNAHINEDWDMYTNEKTENYKPYYNLGRSTINNFVVYDDYKKYSSVSNWDIDASFNDKAFKNGFYYENGATELCWGISKYGNNTYHLSYDVSDMVINTSDGYQVFYWQLIPYDMNPNVQSYDITIRTDDFLSDDLDVWGYGAYGKYAYVSDGVIKLVGEDSLSSDEYVVALVKFSKDTFTTDYTDDRSFDDFYQMAEKGATHFKDKNNSILYRIFNIIVAFMPYIIVAGICVAVAKNTGSNIYFRRLKFTDDTKKLPNDYPMFRDIPCDKNIYIANYIAKAYNVIKIDNNFIGCIVLKWLKDNVITIDNTNPKKPKIILSSTTLPENYNAPTHETNLFTWMNEASKDGVLTTDDFKKYCKNHYNKILNWSNNGYLEGRTECINENYLSKDDVKGNSYTVNHKFYEEGVKIAGLKKFLVDFSDMKNKEPIEVHLWEDYLIFAQMFGIAKKVAKQFKDLYPEVYEQGNYDYATFIFINDFTYTGYHAASAARSAAQSYSSGGGGFSSGGGGGGSFGGGGGGGGSR